MVYCVSPDSVACPLRLPPPPLAVLPHVSSWAVTVEAESDLPHSRSAGESVPGEDMVQTSFSNSRVTLVCKVPLPLWATINTKCTYLPQKQSCNVQFTYSGCTVQPLDCNFEPRAGPLIYLADSVSSCYTIQLFDCFFRHSYGTAESYLIASSAPKAAQRTHSAHYLLPTHNITYLIWRLGS